MKKELKFYHGLAVFAVVIALMLFVFAPVQSSLGMLGLAITELGFAVIALGCGYLFSKTFGLRMSEIFPLNPPPVKSFFAGLFTYAGAYLLMVPAALVTSYAFPDSSASTSSLMEVGTSVSPAAAVLIMAVMPAICEELLHRGLILSSCKSLRKKDGTQNTVLIVLLCGAIFGIFHLDPYRFLTTAVLGGAFAYIALRTGSMLLPMIFHFFNNMMSVVAMFALSSLGDELENTIASAENAIGYTLEQTPLIIAGSCLVYVAGAVVCLFIGSRLFASDHAPIKKVFAVLLTAFLLFSAGMALTVVETSRQLEEQGIGLTIDSGSAETGEAAETPELPTQSV